MFDVWPKTTEPGFSILATDNPAPCPAELATPVNKSIIDALIKYQENSKYIHIRSQTQGDLEETKKAILAYLYEAQARMPFKQPPSMIEQSANTEALAADKHYRALMKSEDFADPLPTGVTLWHGFALIPSDDAKWQCGPLEPFETFKSFSFNPYCGMHYAQTRAGNAKDTGGKPALLKLEVKGEMRVFPIIGLPGANSDHAWQQEVVSVPGLQIEVVERTVVDGAPANDDLVVISAITR